jgi:multicomponent Na+:H+ antiporter subunit E
MKQFRLAILRFAMFAFLWVVLAGVAPLDLLVGAFATVGAAWVSLRLLPPSGRRFHWLAILWLAVRFLWSSVVAGVDVAWRAFHPRMPLRPGFVRYQCGIPAGTARDFYLCMASLVPGSVPAGFEDGHVVVHCLDMALPVAKDMADNEGRLRRVLGEDGAHG